MDVHAVHIVSRLSQAVASLAGAPRHYPERPQRAGPEADGIAHSSLIQGVVHGLCLSCKARFALIKLRGKVLHVVFRLTADTHHHPSLCPRRHQDKTTTRLQLLEAAEASCLAQLPPPAALSFMDSSNMVNAVLQPGSFS